VRSEYTKYAQEHNIVLQPPPQQDASTGASATVEEPKVDSTSTLITFVVIVVGVVAVAVFYALAQAKKREASIPDSVRRQKYKAQAKKQRKGKLVD
jgi:heme/copper-type cytochrome/quinol oxidase subunit 2